MGKLTAIEFFSGIGAFSQAASGKGLSIAAFDQSTAANATYLLNYGRRPCAANLDTLKAQDVPAADIWWLSPPCQPFTVRGKGKDAADTRARCLDNLIEQLPRLAPKLVLLENVLGFAGSQMHRRLLAALARSALIAHQIELCPTVFGVPMRRPRLFIVAASDESWFDQRLLPAKTAGRQTLSDFLQSRPDPQLTIRQDVCHRYGKSWHIIDDPLAADVVATCFTSGYGRCMKSAGSFLRTDKAGIRRFAPREQLALFGFADNFAFPAGMDFKTQWRLIGNSVDVRAIKHLLAASEEVSAILTP